MRKFLFESEYTTAMRETLLPALRAARREGHFAGYDGAPLAFVRYDAPDPRGTVLIVHGLNESTEKYRELAAYFLEAGLSVLLYDQRGHGRSPRAVRPRLVHIDSFAEYVDDLASCVQQVLADCPAPYYLYSHSMGGAVSALYLERGEHPFSKAILSSPMIHTFRYPLIPPAPVRWACNLISALGFGKKKVFVMKEPAGEEDFADSCSLSPARFAAYAAIKRENPVYQSGAVTFDWARAAMGVTRDILRKGAPERISIPLRLYSAEFDSLVDNPPQRIFIDRVPKGEFVLVKGSKHEIYGASDDILHPYLDSVISFFEAR